MLSLVAVTNLHIRLGIAVVLTSDHLQPETRHGYPDDTSAALGTKATRVWESKGHHSVTAPTESSQTSFFSLFSAFSSIPVPSFSLRRLGAAPPASTLVHFSDGQMNEI